MQGLVRTWRRAGTWRPSQDVTKFTNELRSKAEDLYVELVEFFLKIIGARNSHVRGSNSARVPRSSLAEVHREFVQEERQDDGREDRQQREESGEVEENQTHNMSAWR